MRWAGRRVEYACARMQVRVQSAGGGMLGVRGAYVEAALWKYRSDEGLGATEVCDCPGGRWCGGVAGARGVVGSV